MSEMVERVARAIFSSQQMPGDDPDFLKAHPWTQSACLQASRAAIEAMREPTKAMVDAADPYGIIRANFEAAWEDMIDEALK